MIDFLAPFINTVVHLQPPNIGQVLLQHLQNRLYLWVLPQMSWLHCYNIPEGRENRVMK